MKNAFSILHIYACSKILVVMVADNCASRAIQIQGGGDVGRRVESDHCYIMSQMSFNTTGNIISLILRAEIRAIIDMANYMGNSYPTISLYR